MRRIAFAALLIACDSTERRDAASVVAAVQRFRSADNASTPAMVEALRATPCSTPDACKVRDECLAVGETTSKALRLKSQVERSLAALESGAITKDSDEAKALPKKLDDAEVFLKQGLDSIPKCDEAVQALKRKHRL